PTARSHLDERGYVLGVVHEVARTVAANSSDRQRDEILACLKIQEQAEVLPRESHVLRVLSRRLVQHLPLRGQKTRVPAVQAGTRGVRAGRLDGRNDEEDQVAVLCRGEEVADLQRLRQAVTVKVEDQAVRHASPAMDQRDGIVQEGLGVQLQSN